LASAAPYGGRKSDPQATLSYLADHATVDGNHLLRDHRA
jgi:hypothetical protein